MKMIWLLLSLLICYGTSLAQDHRFGVRTGANFANFVGSDADTESDMNIDLYLGMVVEFILDKNWSVQPEAVYSRQGTINKNNGTKNTVSTRYLNFPLLTKYYLAEWFFLSTGPQPGILFVAENQSETNGFPTTTDIKDNYKAIDFSWVIGLGGRLPFGLEIEARYNRGLASLPKSNRGVNIYNGVLQLGLAFTM